MKSYLLHISLKYISQSSRFGNGAILYRRSEFDNFAIPWILDGLISRTTRKSFPLVQSWFLDSSLKKREDVCHIGSLAFANRSRWDQWEIRRCNRKEETLKTFKTQRINDLTRAIPARDQGKRRPIWWGLVDLLVWEHISSHSFYAYTNFHTVYCFHEPICKHCGCTQDPFSSA